MITTHFCTPIQHLFAVAVHHVIDQAATPPWFDAVLPVPGALTRRQLISP